MWSIFAPHLCDFYGWENTAVSLTGSIMLGLFVAGILLGGKLQSRYGSQKIAILGSLLFAGGIFLTSFVNAEMPILLYISYGIIAGLGVGITYSSIIACSQSWFEDKKGLASGITIAAFGLSVVIFSPIAETLLISFDPPTTFRILAVIFLGIILICSINIKDKPTSVDNFQNCDIINGVKQYKMRELFKEKEYYLLTIILFLITPTYFIIIPLLRSLAEMRGLSPELAVFSVMLAGIASCTGRFVLASLSDKIGRRNTLLLESVAIIGATILLINATGIFFLVIIAIIAAFFGGIAAIMPPISADYFGTKYVAGNYGCVMIGWGCSAIVFPLINNHIMAITNNNYALTFLIPIITTCVAIFLIFRLRKDHSKEKQAEIPKQ
jgi:OFA family oxalate/formate antiporter-like MFS transporter